MAICKIYVKDRDEKFVETVYLLEGDINPENFLPLFANPLTQTHSWQTQLDESSGPVFEIRYHKAVVDPELNSLFAAAKALGENNLEWGRIGKRYQFAGVSEKEARKIVEERLFNPVIQEIVDPNETITTLKPSGIPDPVRRIELRTLSGEELLILSQENSWNAPLDHLKTIRRYALIEARPLTDAEIEIFVASWSDHCYHTTWKGLGLLDRLKKATEKINHPRVVSVFHDNAGGIDFDGETVIILKGETHNHPSAIAPFGGVSTKHGGVIRDIIGFGKGGYPIGGTTIMGVGIREKTPEGCLAPERIVRESIEATAAYCNPMGIPILHALYKQHEGYAKCFALGHSIGIIPKKYALKEDPHPRDTALLIGGRTGRDGIHGATASSASTTSESMEKDFATVQIGDPITERKFMEAIPRLRDAGYIRSLYDLGAGGIAGAAGEAGEKTGICINLDKVLLKDTGLSAREILISESQERMLLVIPPKKLREAKRILRAYSIEYAAIGKFTDTKKFEAFWQGQKVVDIDMDFLWGACPIEELPVSEPIDHTWETEADINLAGSLDTTAVDALFQFDKTVQGRTVIEPLDEGGLTNVSLLAPTRTNRGIVTTIAYNPEYATLHPRTYVDLIFNDAVSRAIEAGADPENIFLCSNFYTPKPTPQNNWYLREMVYRLSELTEKHGIPIINGKDSSSGTFIGEDGTRIDVPHTLVLMALGIVPDIKKAKESL